MLFIEGMISAICFLLLFIIVIMAEEKIRVLSLLISFLFAMNSIILLYRYLPTMEGATEVSYLYLFSLNADQIVLLFRLSVLISLVSFTIFAYLTYYKKD